MVCVYVVCDALEVECLPMKVEHRDSDVLYCLTSDEVEAVLYLYFRRIGWCVVVAWTTFVQLIHHDEVYFLVVVSNLRVYYPVSCHLSIVLVHRVPRLFMTSV